MSPQSFKWLGDFFVPCAVCHPPPQITLTLVRNYKSQLFSCILQQTAMHPSTYIMQAHVPQKKKLLK